jgi:alpha-tubulin suppressor-like RCC1 family protein
VTGARSVVVAGALAAGVGGAACSAILGFQPGALEPSDGGSSGPDVAGDEPGATDGPVPAEGGGSSSGNASSGGSSSGMGSSSGSGGSSGASDAGSIRAIAAGGDDTCVVLQSGIECWGDNSFGQIGYATSSAQVSTVSTPTVLDKVPVPGGQPVVVAVGGDHTCAGLGPMPSCWGDDTYGQLGQGAESPETVPVPVSAIPWAATNGVMAAGLQHTCAQCPGVPLECWGNAVAGDLGTTNTGPQPTPAPINPAGLGGSVLLLATGLMHTCAASAGGIYCFGDNTYGQLGYSSGGSSPTPKPVTSVPNPATALTAGAYHTCAVFGGSDAGGGMTMCWGRGDSGQLGTAGSVSPGTPVPAPLGQNAVALAAGDDFTCALLYGGAVTCWGDDSFGQLGGGGKPISQGAVALAAGAHHACAVVSASGQMAVMCWGSNSAGQLGIPATKSSTCIDAGVDTPCSPQPIAVSL